MTAIRAGLDNSGVVAWRNLVNTRRTPGAVFTGVVQPIMFVLLLAFVFGGSLGGASYREFLIGGILAQTLTFNASFTAVGLANDLQQGLVDRYLTLPMARSAVILGRTISDLAISGVSIAVTMLTGLAIGWRPHGGVLAFIGAILLLLLFTFAMSWVGAVVGLAAGSVEVAQSLGLVWLFPVTFVSGAFVSISSLPTVLRVIAQWNPVTAVATSVRRLFADRAPTRLTPPSGWAAEHAYLLAVTYSLAIVAVFAVVSVALFRRVGER